MYVNPLTPPVIFPVNQGTLNTWDRQLENPGPITGLSGMGLGLGCAECGGTCGGKNTGMSGWMDELSPFTSLLLHLGAAYIAYRMFKMIFLAGPAKERNDAIAHAKRRRARAISAGDAAVKRAKRRPRLTAASLLEA